MYHRLQDWLEKLREREEQKKTQIELAAAAQGCERVLCFVLGFQTICCNITSQNGVFANWTLSTGFSKSGGNSGVTDLPSPKSVPIIRTKTVRFNCTGLVKPVVISTGFYNGSIKTGGNWLKNVKI